MVSENQIKRGLRFAAPVFEEYFEKEIARSLLELMQARYRIIAPDVPVLKSPFNSMNMTIAVDALAFYQALQSALSKEDALQRMDDFINNWVDSQFGAWAVKTIHGNRTLHLFYRRKWFEMVNKANETDGQYAEFLPPKVDLFYGVNVTCCGLVNFLTRQGAPEICPPICRGDFRINKYLPKGVEMKRTQTIAEGAPFCDFRYYLVD